MRGYFTLCTLTLALLFQNPLKADIIEVPADSSTIQAGIDGASDGDTVLVAKGHYYERINFLGKEILVGSNFIFDDDTITIDSTIIDGEGTGIVVTFNCVQPCSPRIEGFTITNGNASRGGGIFCMNCMPVIANNLITGNCAGDGGGIYCADRYSPIILNNRITGNSAEYGGGIWCELESRAIIRDNIIVGNQAAEYGAGIGSMHNSSLQICGNFITNNSAGNMGGGICLTTSHGFMDSNTIVHNNGGAGGGVCCWGSYSLVVMSNSIVAHNSAAFDGGGLFVNGLSSSCSLSYNLIVSNSAVRYGGGISCGGMFGGGVITRNAIDGNSAGYLGGGIECYYSPVLIISNIISNSSDGEGIASGESYYYPTISHNNVWNNLDSNFYDCPAGVGDMTWGTNVNGEPCDSFFNISCPPLFCFPDTGDYYLAENSCCVGAGEEGVDIGAFGIGCPAYVLGDVNRDGVIDIVDLVNLIDYLYRNAPLLMLYPQEIPIMTV